MSEFGIYGSTQQRSIDDHHHHHHRNRQGNQNENLNPGNSKDIAEELDACPTLIWSDGDLFYADPALKTIQHILPQQNTALFFELRSLFHAQLNQERIPVLSELLQNQYPNNTRLKSKEERFNATVWAILTLAEAESSSDSPSERITALATQFMETNIPPFTNSPDLFPDFPTLSLSLHYFLLKRRFETLEHTLRAKNPTFHLAFSDLKHQLLARFDNRPSGVFSFTRCTELIQNIAVLWGKIQSKTITPSDIECFTKDTKPFQEHYRIKIAIVAIIGLLAGFIAGFFMGSLPGSLVGASAGGVLGSAIGGGIGFFSTSHDPLQRMNRIAQKEYKENCIFETSNGTISTINP